MSGALYGYVVMVVVLLAAFLLLLLAIFFELRHISNALRGQPYNPIPVDYGGPWTLDTATTASSGEGGGDAVR